MKKYVLGIDVGVTSCAAVAIEVVEGASHLESIGVLDSSVRIFSQTYEKGATGYASKAAQRTMIRQVRRQTDRRINRKAKFIRVACNTLGVCKGDLKSISCSPELRSMAVTERISLSELIVVLSRIGGSRGYAGALNNTDGAVGGGAKDLDDKLNKLKCELNLDVTPTVGQLLHHNHQQGLPSKLGVGYAVNGRLLFALRSHYEYEYDAILGAQSKYHPELKQYAEKLKEILFFQHPLKSCVDATGNCSVEPRHTRSHVCTDEYQQFKSYKIACDLRWNNGGGVSMPLTVEQFNRVVWLLNNPDMLDENGYVTYKAIREHLISNVNASRGESGMAFTHEKSDLSKTKGNTTNLAFNNLGLLKEWLSLDSKNKGRLIKLFNDKGFCSLMGDDNAVMDWFNTVKPYSTLKCRDMEAWTELVSFSKSVISAAASKKIKISTLKSIGLDVGASSYCTKTLCGICDYIKEMLVSGDALSFESLERDAVAYIKYSSMEMRKGVVRSEIDGTWASLTENMDDDLLDWVDGVIKATSKKIDHENYPLPLKTTNPVVNRGMRQVAYLIKNMIRKHGVPSQIIIETAREFAMGADTLNEYERTQKDNEIKNLTTNAMIVKSGHQVTGSSLKRARLFVEQGGSETKSACCSLCSEEITLEQALNGSETNFEHINPQSNTHVGYRMNELTLAHRGCNMEKGNNFPLDAFSGDKVRVKAIKDMAKKFRVLAKRGRSDYFNYKADLLEFSQDGKGKVKSLPEYRAVGASYMDNSMQATGWIARGLANWLKPMGVSISFTKGTVTSTLRAKWDLNNVIPHVRATEKRFVVKRGLDDKGSFSEVLPVQKEEVDYLLSLYSDSPLVISEELKERYKRSRYNKRIDNRHHVLDALVIALSSLSTYKKVMDAKKNKENIYIPLPWSTLREDAVDTIKGCNVYHVRKKDVAKKFFKANKNKLIGSVDENGKVTGNLAQRKSIKSLATGDLKPSVIKAFIDNMVSNEIKISLLNQIKEKCEQVGVCVDDDGVPLDDAVSKLANERYELNICCDDAAGGCDNGITNTIADKDESVVAEKDRGKFIKVFIKDFYASLFIVRLNGNDLYGIKHHSYHADQIVKVVMCYVKVGATKAKAESAIGVENKNGGVDYWQKNGNACVVIRTNGKGKRVIRCVTAYEYYNTFSKADGEHAIFMGDTVRVSSQNGERTMLVCGLRASGSLFLKDVVEHESDRVLDGATKADYPCGMSKILKIGAKSLGDLIF